MINETSIETYSKVVEFLYDLQQFGAKFGLENTFSLARLAGNPERKLRFIHVAGTNGKGSTCAMLESIYRTAGLRVGLFTSPHLVSFRERIQVDRQLISEADVVRLTREMRQLLGTIYQQSQPTFFETITIMALLYFVEQHCDLVIWETGLGGRLDATNIVIPLASVITNIHYDHQKWLGNTLASIAAEKAGIIKRGIPVITGVEEGEALEVIAKTASQNESPLFRASAIPSYDFDILPLHGDYQRSNLAVVLATVQCLQNILPVSDDCIRKGLASVSWPGRMQLFTQPSGQKILLDGAHNVAGAQALAAYIRKQFPPKHPVLVLGILLDKDLSGICEVLAPLTNRLVLVPVHSGRTATPDTLANVCRQYNPDARITVTPSLRGALTTTAEDSFVVITGSLYLVGEAMELLKVVPTGVQSERGLNEWIVKNKPAISTG